MKMLGTSEVFNQLNKASSNSFTDVMKAIVSGNNKDITIITNQLDIPLNTLKNRKINFVIIKAIDAFKNGDIQMYYTKNPKYNLHASMPFFKYVSNEKYKVVINVTAHAKCREYGEDMEMDIPISKLYSLLLSAYYFLALFDQKTVLPNKIIGMSARIWAAIYMKTMNRILTLSSNREKHDAFRYLTEIFFMRYYLDTPPTIATEIAIKDFRGSKPNMAFDIEDKIENKSLDVYNDFFLFTDTMLNPDITGASTFSVNTSVISSKFFVNQFIKMYGIGTYLSLATYPYFVFLIVSLVSDSYIVSKKSFEDIMKSDISSDFKNFIMEMNKMC